MSLEPQGTASLERALSGYLAPLADGAEIPGLGRQRLDLAHPRELTFGPVRRPVKVTGIAVFQDNERILTRALEEPRALAIGQSLRLSVELAASVE